MSVDLLHFGLSLKKVSWVLHWSVLCWFCFTHESHRTTKTSPMYVLLHEGYSVSGEGKWDPRQAVGSIYFFF